MPAAKPVGQQPVGRAGSTTVVQAPYGTQVTKPTTLTRALVAVRKQFFTSKDTQDPQRLYQLLYQMQQGNATALHALASSPLSVGNLLQGNVFTAGQTQYLNHGLGRAYTGWVITRVQKTAGGVAAAGNIYSNAGDSFGQSLTTSFTVITATHAGLANGCTLNAGAGTITVTNAGTYLITWTGVANCPNTLTLNVAINGTVQPDLEVFDSLGTTLGLSTACPKSLNAGDVVTLQGKVSVASTLTLFESNLSVVSVGAPPVPTLTEATLLGSVTSDKQIGLTANIAGTYDLYIF